MALTRKQETTLIDTLVSDEYTIKRWEAIAEHLDISAQDRAEIKAKFATEQNYRNVFGAIWAAYKNQGRDSTVKKFTTVLKIVRSVAVAEKIEKLLEKIPEHANNVEDERDGTFGPRSRHSTTRPSPGSSSTAAHSIDNASRIQNEPSQDSRKVSKKSELDSTLMITEDCWILWLIRRPESKNHQHSFLVLEGIENNLAKTFFFDFVSQSKNHAGKPGTYRGKVQIDVALSKRGEFDQPLMHFGIKSLMKLDRGTNVCGERWQISCATANVLIANVLLSWRNPPPFIILGGSSVFAESVAYSNDDDVGHSCYTWAASQIKKTDPSLKLPNEGGVLGLIATIPEYLLPDSRGPLSIITIILKIFGKMSTKTRAIVFVTLFIILLAIVKLFI